MIEVRLNEHSVFPWRTDRGASIRGEWPGWLDGGPPPADVPRCLTALRDAVGSFAWIARSADGRGVVAAVDERRSFPLFWTQRGGTVLVCDDARVAEFFAEEDARDPVSVAEATVSGFVSGHATLSPAVKQVRAGELLHVIEEAGGASVSVHRWSEEGCCGESSPGEDRLDELDAVLGRVADHLFESVNGRLVVIKLTGGYDSRLLAILARRAGYDRILCLGSNRERHWEVTVGREVAGRLGFPYVHFGYEPHQWREWFASPDRRRYYREADGLSSLPSMIEWPALLELRRSGRADEDAVIVPGHFGGFVSGMCTLEPEERSRADSVDRAVGNILLRRYCLNRLPSARAPLGRALVDRVRSVVRETAGEAASVDEIVDRWEWKEYQAKRVGSAVRAYEYFGFEWRLPYLDRDLVSFWRRASVDERFECRLHHDYVRRAGERWNLPPANPGVVLLSRRRGRRWAKRFGLLGPARRARQVVRRWDGRGISRGDGLGWSCLFPPEDVRRTYTGLEGVESYLIREWLEGARS
jgi:asparagine synthase (glutamine-hydrolysing)